jgi:PIN domain nuclease of toxin-antitoxin system
MTSCVLDASAILALGHDEDGAHVVAEQLENAAISAVNWSEVIRRSRERDVDPHAVRTALADANVVVVPFDESDADTAATLCERTRRAGLSLADRACLALASRLGVPAVTADRAWANLDVDVEVLCIR